ncbi:MAG: Nif3-like dinuclear metal center hexameric protein, partial [Candidatus Heimdallarchaeota archaeon]
GDLNRNIERICIIGGNKPDINYISKSLKEGCDCFISGSITDFEAIYGKEMGISLIEASQYKIKILALRKLCNVLSLEFPFVEFLLFESKEALKIYL